MPQVKTVLVFGTFDRLHPGHRNFFRQAARLGRVVAIVARDTRVKKIKGRLPQESQSQRLRNVKQEPLIAAAYLGHPTDLLQPIRKIKPDLIALGYDQQTFSVNAIKSKLKRLGLQPKIIRLKPFQPKKFKTSLLGKYNF